MADVETEIRNLLERAADQPVEPLRFDAIHAATGDRAERRPRWQVGGVIAAIAAIVVATVLLVPSKSSPPGPIAIPIGSGGPSASALVHGVWKAIPQAPIKVCDPAVVSTGSGAFVLETGLNHSCAPAGAFLNAATDTWTQIAAPPEFPSQRPLSIWGHDRLTLVSRASGEGWQWQPATNRWTFLGVRSMASTSIRTGRVPFLKNPPEVASVTWQGDTLLAAEVVNGRTHFLNVSAPLEAPRVPPPAPATGRVVSASITTLHGYLLLAQASDSADGKSHVSVSKLDAQGHWMQAVSSISRKLRDLQSYGGTPAGISAVGNQLLVIGDRCPTGCVGDTQKAVLIRAAASNERRERLRLHDNAYVSALIAVGQHSLVTIYPRGLLARGSTTDRAVVSIYDVVQRRWHRAPDLPASPMNALGFSAAWSSQGVILFRTAGVSGTAGSHVVQGWILAPH